MENVAIGFAEPQDAASIVELFASSFRPEIAQLLIYSCKGASEYLRMLICSRSNQPGTVFFVAKESNGHVLAATEIRRKAGGIVLKYIAVEPDHCGSGLGIKLFSSAIKSLEIHSGQIILDVFHESIQSLNWCRRHGFVNGSSTVYLELIPPTVSGCYSASISNLTKADICQTRFGFSQLAVATNSGSHTIRRIGTTWFLITDQEAVDKPEIFSLLKQLDPRRRIVAVVPAFSVPNAPVRRVVAKTYRMETTIDKLVPALSYEYDKVLKAS